MTVVEKIGKHSAEILKWIAEYSPKKYAAQIKKRNVELLKLFNKCVKDTDFLTEINEIVSIGCPHCISLIGQACSKCLWTKAINTIAGPNTVKGAYAHAPCLYVSFGGVIAEDPTVRISYGISNCRVARKRKYSQKEIRNTRKLLKEHIIWADQPYWGTKRR